MGPGMPGIQPAADVRPLMGLELWPELVEPVDVNPADVGSPPLPPRPRLRRSERPLHPQRMQQNVSRDRERTPGAAQTVNTTILGYPQHYKDAMATPEAEKWRDCHE